MNINPFGYLPDGREVHRIILSGHGLTVNILNYGAIVQDLRLDGHEPSLVLGYEKLDYYLKHSPYFGAIAGRCTLPVSAYVYKKRLVGLCSQRSRNKL